MTCGPGPFSLGSADLASAQLVSAGYDRITFERLDAEMLLGKDVDDALALAMTLGPAGEILRLAREEGEKRRPELETALRGLLGKYRRADGVWGPASAWIVSARAA